VVESCVRGTAPREGLMLRSCDSVLSKELCSSLLIIYCVLLMLGLLMLHVSSVFSIFL